jgi:hypothetical protein
LTAELSAQAVDDPIGEKSCQRPSSTVDNRDRFNLDQVFGAG